MKWLRVAFAEAAHSETVQYLIASAAIGLMLGLLIGGWVGVLG